MNLSFLDPYNIGPLTSSTVSYTPHFRFVHVPPPCSSSDWPYDFGRPWWNDDNFCIGLLSKKTRLLKVINTLTSRSRVIEVRNFINTYPQIISCCPCALSIAYPAPSDNRRTDTEYRPTDRQHQHLEQKPGATVAVSACVQTNDNNSWDSVMSQSPIRDRYGNVNSS